MADFTYSVISHLTIPVGTSATPVIPLNSNRNYGLFINDSDAVIYLVKGNSATISSGIRLAPYGGHYEMSPANWNLDTAAFSAIHDGTGEKNLLVTIGDNF